MVFQRRCARQRQRIRLVIIVRQHKAADIIDDKTGNKHTDKIDTVADKAKEVVDKLDESDENK